MGFAAAVVIGSALVGAVGAEAFSGGFDNKSSDNPAALPAPPALPNPEQAKDTALATQTRQRQILLATGGQTDYTGGSGALLGTDTTKQTLLGG